MKEFNTGQVYFSVSFVEPKLVYPIVDAFVFVGKNLLANESEDTWYFQDTASYAEGGSFIDHVNGKGQITTFTASRLDDVLGIPELCETLSGAAQGTLTQP
jgi:hypothetical protein